MIVRAIGTANPPRYMTQKEVYEVFSRCFDMQPEERNLYEKLLLDGGPIRGRYFGVDDVEQACQLSPDELITRFQKFGVSTAAEAARQALAEGELNGNDIDVLVVNTCTGYLCPGLSSYLAEGLGLGDSVKVFDLMGMGCGAAIPNLECARGMLNGGPVQRALSVAVEICSATLFMGPQPDLVISNSIFGDGAAAVVLERGGNGEGEGLARLVDFETGTFPRYREHLRYRNQQGRLRNVLSKRVPVIAATAVRDVALRLLGRHGLSPKEIDWWVVHPGGTVILEQVAKTLKLPDEALRYSYEVFRDFGNMSSPSVLFVLKRILTEGHPSRGQRGLMLAFGAGFTAFAALLEF
jgi:predicted naringenin-chalcone synthase